MKFFHMTQMLLHCAQPEMCSLRHPAHGAGVVRLSRQPQHSNQSTAFNGHCRSRGRQQGAFRPACQSECRATQDGEPSRGLAAAECASLASAAARGCGAALAALPLLALPAAAGVLHAEPSNALSLPTWAIHVSSVVEWSAAMALVWRYADASGEQRWKGLTWGMMPLLAGALCACTHHFFYNDPNLDILVALQAGFTVLGNATCWAAAWRIYQASKTDGAGA